MMNAWCFPAEQIEQGLRVHFKIRANAEPVEITNALGRRRPCDVAQPVRNVGA